MRVMCMMNKRHIFCWIFLSLILGTMGMRFIYTPRENKKNGRLFRHLIYSVAIRDWVFVYSFYPHTQKIHFPPAPKMLVFVKRFT